jgi:hypothetical protein
MKNAVYVLLILAVFVLGCNRSDSDSGGIWGALGLTDETDQAAELVGKANDDLREIRKIQKSNIGKLDDLKEAMSGRDTPAAQKILAELITAIGDGIALGETANAKISEATEKKTNDKFNEYLRLKEQALQKQIEAFKFRLQVAKDLRQKFGTTSAEESEKAKADFVRQEESFNKLWDAAEDLNDRANRLARENPRKIRAK